MGGFYNGQRLRDVLKRGCLILDVEFLIICSRKLR